MLHQLPTLGSTQNISDCTPFYVPKYWILLLQLSHDYDQLSGCIATKVSVHDKYMKVYTDFNFTLYKIAVNGVLNDLPPWLIWMLVSMALTQFALRSDLLCFTYAYRRTEKKKWCQNVEELPKLDSTDRRGRDSLKNTKSILTKWKIYNQIRYIVEPMHKVAYTSSLTHRKLNTKL